MRSLSITALMILAAFVLGLALGGQAPREADAMTQPDFTWDSDGVTLALSNHTTTKGYLARGSFLAGTEAEIPPAFVDGLLKLPARDLRGVTVYELRPVFACDPLVCRSCDSAPTLCEMPPRPIPLMERGFLSVVSRIW